jgi:hypothetical protein
VSFFCCPWCCLSFLYLRLLITRYVFLNFYHPVVTRYWFLCYSVAHNMSPSLCAYVFTVYNRTVLKNGSCCTVRPGKVSCLQKFRHFWMIIRDLLFESGSTEATKINKILQRYVIYISDQITVPYLNTETEKSSFKHRGWYVFAWRKGVKIKFFSTYFLNYVKYVLTIWWNRRRRFQIKENMTVSALIFLTTGAFNIVLHSTSLYT